MGSGLTLAQTMVLSLVMFTGASQFAFVGVAAGGGTPFAAVAASLLLAIRNAFYGVPLSEILHPTGLARLWTAHFVIDETTGDGGESSQPSRRALCVLGDRADPVLPVAAGHACSVHSLAARSIPAMLGWMLLRLLFSWRCSGLRCGAGRRAGWHWAAQLWPSPWYL